MTREVISSILSIMEKNSGKFIARSVPCHLANAVSSRFNYLICSIDATVETGSIGRLINHSKTNPNLEVKVITSDDGRPYLCMFAKSNIPPGAELVYDYGERASSAIESFQWLKE